MIIVSDCVKNNLDEGCIKVASTLSKKLTEGGSYLVAVNCDCNYSDSKVDANKFYSNSAIYQAISKGKGDILYIPFASNTLGSAIRTYVLAKKTHKRVNVLFTLRWNMNGLTKFVLNRSKCNILTLSHQSFDYFKKQLPKLLVNNIMTGVDTSKFKSVDVLRKKELRKKYGLPSDKCVIMHVGHLKQGRNIETFLNVSGDYHVMLVFSSVTEQEANLKKELLKKDNITIIEDYCPNIEELYQTADVYVFPVVEENNSIDIPLSVLEAAACNKKIIATSYNEIEYFDKKDGLFVVKDFDKLKINEYIKVVNELAQIDTRAIALKYDWNSAIDYLKESID